MSKRVQIQGGLYRDMSSGRFTGKTGGGAASGAPRGAGRTGQGRGGRVKIMPHKAQAGLSDAPKLNKAQQAEVTDLQQRMKGQPKRVQEKMQQRIDKIMGGTSKSAPSAPAKKKEKPAAAKTASSSSSTSQPVPESAAKKATGSTRKTSSTSAAPKDVKSANKKLAELQEAADAIGTTPKDPNSGVAKIYTPDEARKYGALKKEMRGIQKQFPGAKAPKKPQPKPEPEPETDEYGNELWQPKVTYFEATNPYGPQKQPAPRQVKPKPNPNKNIPGEKLYPGGGGVLAPLPDTPSKQTKTSSSSSAEQTKTSSSSSAGGETTIRLRHEVGKVPLGTTPQQSSSKIHERSKLNPKAKYCGVYKVNNQECDEIDRHLKNLQPDLDKKYQDYKKNGVKKLPTGEKEREKAFQNAHPHVKFTNANGFQPHTKRQVEDTLHELLSEYQHITPKMTMVAVGKMDMMTIAGVPQSHARNPIKQSISGRAILFNQDIMESERLDNFIRYGNRETGQQSKTMKDIVNHEFAHVIHAHNKAKIDSWLSSTKPQKHPGMSKYGKTNKYEAWAEAFCRYRQKTPNQYDDLDKSVHNLVEELKKGRHEL